MIPISKPYIGEAEKKAVLDVLDSGMLAQGPRTAELEECFTEICGTQHAVATSSGTTALHIALLAHGIGDGDEVITTPFTFIASVNSIIFTGARPVFVDIDEKTFNIDPSLIEAALTAKTKAIMPVHLYGYPCEMNTIMDIAKRNRLLVIEDAAQAIGAEFKGQRVGSFGTGCFSLYATKNLMCGEGGMVTTNDAGIAERCRMLRSHGMRRRYYHDILGYNFRMSDIHAAIGIAQCKRLEEFTIKRRENAEYLNDSIVSVVTPKVNEGVKHVWHQYTIRVTDTLNREEAINQLNDAGIGTGIFYPIPAHKQSHMLEMGYGENSLPVAEKLAEEVVSIPVHPQLSQSDLRTMVQEVNKL